VGVSRHRHVVLKNVKPGRSSDAIDRIKAGMGDMIIATDIVRQFPERGFLIYATRWTKEFLMGWVGV